MASRRQRRVPGGRSRIIKVRVTEKAGAELDELAAAGGVSVQRLLVESARADPRVGSRRHQQVLADRLDLVERRLLRIGVNLNQLAARANSTGRIDGGLDGAVEFHARTLGEVRALLDELHR